MDSVWPIKGHDPPHARPLRSLPVLEQRLAEWLLDFERSNEPRLPRVAVQIVRLPRVLRIVLLSRAN